MGRVRVVLGCSLLLACADDGPTQSTESTTGSSASGTMPGSGGSATIESEGSGSGSGSVDSTGVLDTGDSSADSTGEPPAEDRYWVGGDGDWSDPMHWSQTPAGPPGASVPDAVSRVTISGPVAVTLDAGDVEIRGLSCVDATLVAAAETQIAVGSVGVDVAACSLPTDGAHALLGFRFTADAPFDHIQGSVGGTAIDHLDADGHTVTLRPVGDDEIGTDINAHHLDLGSGGALVVDCALATAGCPDSTRIEIQHAMAHGCDVVDVEGTGTVAVGLEHESGSCPVARLGAGYGFEGTVYDLTGGGNAPVYEFVAPGPAFVLDAPFVLEKQAQLRFAGQSLESTSMLRIGNDQNAGTAAAVLEGAVHTVAFVRLDDTDGATLDFAGGGSVTMTDAAGAHGTDLYVAAGGNDAGNDCTAAGTPCATVDRCIERANALGADARCLLARGDVFDERGAGDPRPITASLWVGSYGAGAAPVVMVDVGDRLTATADVRIYDSQWSSS